LPSKYTGIASGRCIRRLAGMEALVAATSRRTR
jgi:hypothetical protein